MPATKEELINSVLNDKEAKFASPDLNIEHKMSVKEYEKLCIYQEDLQNWGPPPGHLNSDGQNLLVYGKKFGSVFVGVQPAFGYGVTPCASSSPSLPLPTTVSRYTYIQKVFGAGASFTGTTVPWSSCPVSRLACPTTATPIS